MTNFGLPNQRVIEKPNGINISISQYPNQTVKLKVIFDLIKDEPTGKQMNEIEEILGTNETPEVKKPKIIEKLKSFGSDVVSNIIANILTNPSLYS